MHLALSLPIIAAVRGLVHWLEVTRLSPLGSLLCDWEIAHTYGCNICTQLFRINGFQLLVISVYSVAISRPGLVLQIVSL